MSHRSVQVTHVCLTFRLAPRRREGRKGAWLVLFAAENEIRADLSSGIIRNLPPEPVRLRDPSGRCRRARSGQWWLMGAGSVPHRPGVCRMGAATQDFLSETKRGVLLHQEKLLSISGAGGKDAEHLELIAVTKRCFYLCDVTGSRALWRSKGLFSCRKHEPWISLFTCITGTFNTPDYT